MHIKQTDPEEHKEIRKSMIENLEEAEDIHALIDKSKDIEITADLKGDIREIEISFRVGEGTAFVQLLDESVESAISGETAKTFLSETQSDKAEYAEAIATIRAMKEALKLSWATNQSN